MRGRKPTPTYLRVLNGNPSERPLNTLEPVPRGELQAPPHWMNDRQKDLWRQIIQTAPPGLLKDLDGSIFTVWVVACDMHSEAVQKVNQYGQMVKSPSGVPMQSPYVSIMNKQALIMKAAAAEMGFTPSSRSRVKVDPKSKQKNNLYEGLKTLGDEEQQP